MQNQKLLQNPVHKMPIRVYYEDTDVAGVVYHPNYIKFMERSRTEWLRELGLDQSILIDQGLAFAIAALEVQYLKPAYFNDQLLVVTHITKVGRASMHFSQSICAAENSELVYCKGVVKVAMVLMHNMQPKPLPDSLRQKLTALQLD